MSDLSPATKPTKSWFPTLTIGEWITFAILAAVLALTNIYSTLMSGWGDGGSIIAVVASVLVLGKVLGRKLQVESLNLGQTMVSAGGTVGFAITGYAAVVMVDPTFDPDPTLMIILFIGMGMIGTVIGSSVRKQMVRYYFPSGTACAVIQKTVSRLGPDADAEAKKPVRLLAMWGGIATAITLPVKITLTKGGHAILSDLSLWASKGVALTFDPLFYGIGIVVGPRVGLGMLIGGLAGPFLIGPILESNGMAAVAYDWTIWTAIASLTLPTFATIWFAFKLKTEAEVPAGFEPGSVVYSPPAGRNPVFGAFTAIGIVITAITGYMVFDIPAYVAVLVIALSWPMCIMNGRVTGETDINPVRLVNIVILSLFVFMVSDNENAAVILIGMSIVGGTLAGMAVDMMQDYRTGYLLNANHNHQTTVQFFGVLIGAVVSVPFMLLLADKIGFGPESTLPAPGPQIYSRMATTLTEQGASLTPGLIACIIIVSVVGCAYAYATVHPKTSRYMPSLFGMGIGLLLPVAASLGIFLGGMIKWGAVKIYTSKATGKKDKSAAEATANDDTLIAGASVFAASALVTVLLILGLLALSRFDLFPFYLAH